MNNNRLISLFLPCVLALLLMSTLFIGCNNGTATTAADVDTFGDYATKGESAYSTYCTTCHGNSFSTGSYAARTLASYNNANSLLNKINTMSGGSGKTGDEILSYFLVENGWISADTAFSKDNLTGISLPRP
jgi:hypothetical protein